MTELERARALRSFRDLLTVAATDPEAFNKFMIELTQTTEPYPEESAVIYLLGMLQGAALVKTGSYEARLVEIVAGHLQFLGMCPGFYIGPKRKYLRTR